MVHHIMGFQKNIRLLQVMDMAIQLAEADITLHHIQDDEILVAQTESGRIAAKEKHSPSVHSRKAILFIHRVIVTVD